MRKLCMREGQSETAAHRACGSPTFKRSRTKLFLITRWLCKIMRQCSDIWIT